ncbi:hypothetical protein [Roseimaritima ulvae]|uniref:Uncharacterized protein n=1 Tax=Roseimaritima ulvae TaxID=980254 RepID=A0A5B9QVC5_9BACT|nr:hypothetical protein [Roseimaritima ulvae]QEG41325.1 hypothetical protein UC8_33440 [Roseimaritima ulvae]
MRISVSVAGSPTANSNAVRCGAEFEVETIDQVALDRMVQTVRQCDAVVRRTDCQTQDSGGGVPSGSTAATGRSLGSGKRLATEKQVKAIHAIARRQGVELDGVLHDRFSVSRVSELSISEASTMIDELKTPTPA